MSKEFKLVLTTQSGTREMPIFGNGFDLTLEVTLVAIADTHHASCAVLLEGEKRLWRRRIVEEIV